MEKNKFIRTETNKAEFDQSSGPDAEPHLREKKLRHELDELYRDKEALKTLRDKQASGSRSRTGISQ